MIGRNELKIKWYPIASNYTNKVKYDTAQYTITAEKHNKFFIYQYESYLHTMSFFAFFSVQPKWLCSEFPSSSINTKTCSNTNNIELLNIIIQANTKGQLRSFKLDWLYLSDSSKRLRKEISITKVWLKILNKTKSLQKHFEINCRSWYNGKFLQ